MAAGERILIGSDIDIVDEIHGLGADALRRCYQCGTCSVVCPLTPLEQAFPRKEMIWAQWGLKDRLLSDADVWLCFQCNDCVTYCPTDARPGDVMAAVRNYQITSYAVPGFLAKASSELKYLPLAFLFPVLIMVGLIWSAILYPNGGRFEFPEGPILFEHLIPHIHIDVVTLSLLAVVFTLAGLGLYRFWRTINEAQPATKKNSFLRSLAFALVEVFTHRGFKECGTSRTRLYAHAAIFYGFIMLVMATTGAFVYTVILPFIGIDYRDGELSLPLYDPVKIIGNVGGVILLVAATQLVFMRLTKREVAGSSVYFDWFFIGVLYTTAFTGFLLEALRFADLKEIAYSSYLVHLLFVYTLFTYFPFSKFAHLAYRILALTQAKQIGREPGPRISPTPAPVPVLSPATSPSSTPSL